MTALEQYAKLEAEGTYFDGQSPDGHEIVLSFGSRTLILGTLQDVPLGHWPLASLRAVHKSEEDGIHLAPDLTSPERVVVSDPVMIDAIEQVCPDLYRKPRRVRSRRGMLRWIGAAAIAGLLTFITFAPGLGDPLAGSIDPTRARTLGDAALGQIGLVLPDRAARPALCTGRDGTLSIGRLIARLAPNQDARTFRVSIIDDPLVHATVLPGGRLLIFRGLLDAARAPDEIAGIMALLIAHANKGDPVRQAYYAAGTFDRMRLVFGAALTGDTVTAAVRAALGTPFEPEETEQAINSAIDQLGIADLPLQPFADLIGRLTGDPMAGPLFAKFPVLPDWSVSVSMSAPAPYRAALPDRDWIALGNICDQTQPIRIEP